MDTILSETTSQPVAVGRAALPRLCFVGPMLGVNPGWVTTQGEIVAGLLAGEGYPVRSTSSIPARLPRLADTLRSLVAWRGQIDLVIHQVFSGPAFVIADTASALCRLLGLRQIFVLHGGALPEFAAARPGWVRRVMGLSLIHILALAAFGFHLMNTPRARSRFLILFGLFGGLFLVGIYPFLDDFTGGSLSQRFSDLDTTGRLEVAQADLEAFRENVIVGTGVGESTAYHQRYLGYSVATHTEFTRLLAEHGLFGIVATAILIFMLAKRYVGNQPGLGRGLTAALAVWATSIMFHSAMRLAVIPLAIALGLALWQLQRPPRRAAAEKPAAKPAGASVNR